MKIPKRLTKEQQAAMNALIALLADQAEADRRYNALADSHGGRVISTDHSRFLDTRYRDTPTRKPRDLIPSWNLRWHHAQDRLRHGLRRLARNETVRVLT